MKVKNVSARPHHVGDVTIAPGYEAEIDNTYKDAINKDELVEVKAEKPAKAEKQAEKPAKEQDKDAE